MKKTLIFIGLKLAEIAGFIIANLLISLMGLWNPATIPISSETNKMPENFWEYLGVGWIYTLLLALVAFVIFLLYIWIVTNSEWADNLSSKNK